MAMNPAKIFAIPGAILLRGALQMGLPPPSPENRISMTNFALQEPLFLKPEIFWFSGFLGREKQKRRQR